jgi:phosphoribosylaminoimidazole carboxylase PurE protein
MLALTPSAAHARRAAAEMLDPAARLTARLLAMARERTARARLAGIPASARPQVHRVRKDPVAGAIGALGARPPRLEDRPLPPLGRARSAPRAAILVGCGGDLDALRPAEEVLRAFCIRCVVYTIDTQHAGEDVRELLTRDETKAVEVVIAGSSDSPLFPGVVAATTLIPVLPAPVPLRAAAAAAPEEDAMGTERAIAAAGAVNAALCAVRILALRDPMLRERIARFDRAGAARAHCERAGW